MSFCRTPVQIACTAGRRLKTKCGLSSRYPSQREVIPVAECTRNCTSHLQNLKVSKERLSEGNLILLRVGIFENSQSATVCPKHRELLGIYWRSIHRCQHPLHKSRKPGKCDRGVSSQMSKEIKEQWNILVQVGSEICRQCREGHKRHMEKHSCATNITLHNDIAVNLFPDTPGNSFNKPTSEKDKEPVLDEECDISICSDIENKDSYLASPDNIDDKDWTSTPKVSKNLSTLNTFLRAVHGRDVSPLRSQCSLSVSDMAGSTVRYYKRKALESCEAVLQCIAPGQSNALLDLIKKDDTQPPLSSSHDSELVNRLVILFEESSSWSTKREILSLFVQDYTKAQLMTMIPGLSKWRIDEARKHAALVGPGRPIELPETHRLRLNPVKVDHFVDFISSPNYLQDVAFGTKAIKLSNGEEFKIPNVVRTVTTTRLVNLYLSFCQENDFEPLGRSTLFGILKACAASQKKSLSGLDSIATEGSSAFQSLQDVATQLSRAGMPFSWCKKVQDQLKRSQNYLKADYKIHVASESRCADHCRTYALSSTEKEFKTKCNHKHDMVCDQCEMLKTSLEEIVAASKSTNIKLSDDQYEEISHEIDTSVAKVKAWKSHILRTVHQETAKSFVLDGLKATQIMIIIDWAMKFIPACYRETQADWYGKKGRPWHVSAVISKNDESGELEVQTFVHVFNQCTQDWFAVASIAENILTTIRRSNPRIKQAFIRSDNAGCYHAAQLILTIPGISKRVGIKVQRYDFSDPQSGKDICDRRIAAMKSHMRRYLNEGNDIKTASDMKRALDSYGGVKSCRIAVVDVDVSKQSITDHKWKGIQSLNNFEFLSTGIRVWKAFGIGKGKLIKNQVLKNMASPQQNTGLGIVEPFSDPAVDKGMFAKISKEKPSTQQPATGDSADNCRPSESISEARGFSCPDINCIKVFRSSGALDRHLDSGKHLYRAHHESAYDSIKRKWVTACTSVGSVPVATTENNTLEGCSQVAKSGVEPGWALKKSKPRGRYSDKLKKYLKKLFLEGEETGRKADPSDVSSRIKSLKTNDGKKRLFDRSDWLTAQQVRSYFSRLSVLQRCGKLQTCGEDDDDDDEIKALEEALERQKKVDAIYYDVEI